MCDVKVGFVNILTKCTPKLWERSQNWILKKSKTIYFHIKNVESGLLFFGPYLFENYPPIKFETSH